jgi:hypothetical protein
MCAANGRRKCLENKEGKTPPLNFEPALTAHMKKVRKIGFGNFEQKFSKMGKTFVQSAENAF